MIDFFSVCLMNQSLDFGRVHNVPAVTPLFLACSCLLQSVIFPRDVGTLVCKQNWYQVLRTNPNVNDLVLLQHPT